MSHQRSLLKQMKAFGLLTLSLSYFAYLSFPAFAKDSKKEEFKERERTELRTLTTKVFQTGEKSFRLESYSDKIHYKNGNNYLDVNNNVVQIDDSRFKFKNGSNDFNFLAGKDLSSGVKYQKGSQICEFKLSDIKDTKLNNSSAQSNGNKVTYSDIYPNADLEFTILSTGIKTEIVAKGKNALKEEFEFELTNCNKETFAKSVMENRKVKVQIGEEVRESDGKKKLVLKPDYSKLISTDGEVRIDPSIIEPSPTQDVFLSTSTSFGNRRMMFVGQYTDYTIPGTPTFYNSTALMKFNISLPAGAILTDSQLKIYQYGSNGVATSITVSRITSPWSEDSSYPGPTYEGSYASETIPVWNTNDSNQIAERIINLDNSLINQLTSGNNGFLIRPSGSSNSLGFVFCSKDSDGFCQDRHDPKLIINYTLNQPPFTPNLISPANSSMLSGNCDESSIPATGNCRTQKSVDFQIGNVGDSDLPPSDLDKTFIDFFQNGNYIRSSDAIYGNGNISWAGGFGDGKYSWKAHSVDKTGAWGSFSNESSFSIDTTPPDISAVNILPQFAKGVGINDSIQVEVAGNKTGDNLSLQNQISYYLEYSNTSNFSSNIFSKSWQIDNPVFQIGPKGADGIAGNGDDLADGGTYYFKIKSKDSYGNISGWSNIVSTTIDSTKPVINNFSATEIRFSPNNSTSTGFKDNTAFKFDYIEKHPFEAKVEVYSDTNRTNRVKTIIQNISANEGSESSAGLSFVWDGKSDSGSFLSDGAYQAIVKVSDKAGNITESDPLIVVVDNSGANITISSPVNNIWTNQSSIEIKGQVLVPNEANKEDGDISKLRIKNEKSTTWEEVAFDTLGLFNKNVNLEQGKNLFDLETEDTVGNKTIVLRSINYEVTPPVISNIQPNSLIKNTKPSITFTVTDPDLIGDKSQTSGIPVGMNPANMKIWLTYQTGDKTNTKVLVDNGVNIDPALVGNLVCTQSSSSSNVDCTLPFVADLQPDGIYTIHIQVSDIAGNKVTKEDTSFILDSHVYSELLKPSAGATYSSSSVLFKGKASKNSELNINNAQLNRTKKFILNEALNNTGRDSYTDPNRLVTSNFVVTCGEFKDIDNRADTPDEEICLWEVKVLQKFNNSNSSTQNTNIITVTDSAGNYLVHNISFNVNLYAFDIEVSSDLQYFSPNGDGRQDGVKFTHTVLNPTDATVLLEIKNYELKINSENGKIVKIFSGFNLLPLNSFWDGKSNGAWVSDGEYKFVLSVTTSDGITLSTQPQPIFARTALNNSVVITNPKSGYITTNGVITVQGQAPKPQNSEGNLSSLRGKVLVDICVDTLGTSVTCDMISTVEADQNGFFSSLVVLPRLNQSQISHHLTAKARDEFGNTTADSNTVLVIQDTIDPFKNVYITPALTGVNTQEDYQKFLNGEINIDKLRSMRLTSEVTQNTEQVQYSFAEYTNLYERPDNPNFKFIATVNDTKESDTKLNPNNLDSIKKNYDKFLGDLSIPSANCNSSTSCLWEYYLPVQNGWGGTYEVEFKAKKGDVVKSMTAGFRVDGNIPASPIIMVVEKWDEEKNSWVNIEPFNLQYYSNKTKIRLRGAAEPNINLQLAINNLQIVPFIASQSGVWEYTVDLESYLDQFCKERQSGKCGFADLEFSLMAFRQDDKGNRTNVVPGSNKAKIVYDSILPKITAIKRTTPDTTAPGWIQTGMKAHYSIDVNERLRYSDLIKEDGYTTLMSAVNSEGLSWNNAITIDRKAEGFYNPQIKIVDLAGNINTYDSKKHLDSGLGDWRIYIDNTRPDSSQIDKNGWGVDGGVKADGVLPEAGRLNPEYVIKADRVEIKGLAEREQRLEILVNGNSVAKINVNSDSCHRIVEDRVTIDGLLVKSGEVCSYNYTYSFLDKGENDQFGTPVNSFSFQVRVIDNAANQSEVSKQEIIYHDKKSPGEIYIKSISSPSYNPVIGWSGYSLITKDREVMLESSAEKLADLEYFVGKKDEAQDYRLIQNDFNGKTVQKLNLGSKKDEDRANCTKVNSGRRIGICEDGIYTIRLFATDAAGNKSEEQKVSIERDTVKPLAPELSDPYLCGKSICIRIKGELNTEVISNNKNLGTLKTNDQQIVLQSTQKQGVDYKFNIKLVDIAGNSSDFAVRSFNIPEPELSGGAVLGATSENPYFDANGGDLDAIRFDVSVKYGRNKYSISNIQIPKPYLTYVYTQYTDDIDIYGVAIPKNHPIYANITIEYMTYDEADEYCNARTVIYSEKVKCMEKSMGINSRSDWEFETLLECKKWIFFLPLLANCQYDKMATKRRVEEKKDQMYEAQHVMVTFHKDDKDNAQIGELWNDSPDGRFTYNRKLDEVIKVKDYVKSRVAIFGDFQIAEVTVDYRGLNEGDEKTGLKSDFSDSLIIDKSEYTNLNGKKAKILDVPYFNQYLEPNGSYNPSGGWYMCGAASSVMVAGYFDKLNYDKNDEHSLKKYMYSDSGQGISQSCGPDKGGAFGLTNYRCSQNWNGGIVKYLESRGLEWNYIAGTPVNSSGVKVGVPQGSLTFAKIKKSIDSGKPVIIGFRVSNYAGSKDPLGHIAVISGYTTEKVNGKVEEYLVMNDPFRNIQQVEIRKYDYNGKNALYRLDYRWNILYAIEFSKNK